MSSTKPRRRGACPVGPGDRAPRSPNGQTVRSGASSARLLRDRKSLTRLQIMFELSLSEPTRPKQLGEAIGITIQGTLNHLREMVDEGQAVLSSDGYALTPAGRQALLESMRGLKRYADEAVARLNVIDACSAVAGSGIAEGEHVGLFMEEGELVARAHKDSTSTGRALSTAERGDEVIVGDLEGVVEITPARVWVMRVPGAGEGGARALSQRSLQAALREVDAARVRAGAVGTEGRRVLKASGLARTFVFAPVAAAFNAAQLGLESLLFVPGPQMKDVLGEIETYNSTAPDRVAITVINPGGADKSGR